MHPFRHGYLKESSSSTTHWNKEDVTFLSSLKTCAKKKDIHQINRIYSDIVKKGVHGTLPYLCTSIICCYSRCGLLEDAQNVLKKLHHRDVVSWTALITGYVQEGRDYEALECFQQMQDEGIFPNSITCISILKACGCTKVLYDQGKKMHQKIVCRGLLEKDIVLGTSLVDMYAKCGDFDEAQSVLFELPSRDVVSWSVLISGYAQQGQIHQAFKCFEDMQMEGLYPDLVTFVCLLKACGKARSMRKGKQIHEAIVNRGLLEKNDVVLSSSLVDMYAKCGNLTKALEVFEEVPFRNVISWSSLITGYVQQGHFHKALTCYERMKNEGLSPDIIAFTCMLMACGNARDIDKGKQIHEEVIGRALLEKDIMVGNALVDMYVKFGDLSEAQLVLEEISMRDVVSWSTLITGYAQQGKINEALTCFDQMQNEGVCPNVVTFVCILKACAIRGALRKGEQMHRDIVNRCWLEKDIVLGNALVDMYVKCGVLGKAREVLNGLPIRNVISWNTLIGGYGQHGQYTEALYCFEQMQSEGIFPNEVTLISMLKACGGTSNISKGREIHDNILCRGWPEKAALLGTALVDMYAKCGVIAKAEEVLKELPIQDTVTWNALMGGYNRCGRHHEVLNCYESVQSKGIAANVVTYICILKSCRSIGAVEKGGEIHRDISHRGLLKDIVVGGVMVDMYAKNGVFRRARQVLEELPVRNVIVWSALISGYAEQGRSREAFECIEEMRKEGLSPNEITFTSLLRACNHSGLFNVAQNYVSRMIIEHSIIPSIEHDTCMVLVYGYIGHFEKAMSLVKATPYSNGPNIWLALLSACRKWGNIKVGRWAFDNVVRVDM